MDQMDMFQELGYPLNVHFARGTREVGDAADFINLEPMAGNRVTVLSILIIHADAGAASVDIRVGGVVVAKIIMAQGTKFHLVSLPEGMIMSAGGQAVTFRNVSGAAIRFVWVVGFQDGSKYVKGE